MKSLDQVETLISGPPSEPSSPNRDLDKDEEEEEECEYDDEEEDVDFNPFLKDSPSREASSSLSSEVETLDGEIVNSITTVPQTLEGRQGKEDIAMPSNDVSCQEPPIPDERTVGAANENGEQLVIQTQKQDLMSTEEDDAICKRTRARYSLASFTLDDLEAFLQETDDEDDIPNVDDEEEYRKFLAAVLHSGDTEVPLAQTGTNDDDDDDDEDNDLDFEIELEEALETDDEEIIPEKVTTGDNISTKRRPVTRQKRRQNISIHHKNNSPEQAGRLLRPLVPILPIAPPGRRVSATEAVASSENRTINGFTQAQMGELHSLIHDHLQLLIQVYSLCALDHSRQSIGTHVQGLLSEMLKQHQGYISRRSHLLVTGSASSVLDVVGLAGRYLVDVSDAVQDYRRCQVESGFDTSSQRVPLFTLPHQEVGGEIVNYPLSSPSSSKSPSGQQQAKKTLAATLVESAQKQSVALVHKDIAKLAKRFMPLFKVSLYPHKPPHAAVANRVLFTDAEDELLALGIMEYNSDWKAIKQRFLPSKGEHQIYVRQKNRRSSKAPENPIKAVLRMKSSPLTPQEILRIQEGLKYFKYDWTSVWKFVVPYRDPSLLPRQWRTALGIQKSYKLDAVKKEKRRLYDTNRKFREQQASAKEDRYGASKANEYHVGGELVESSGEAYLHEGFLADWRPGMPTFFSSAPMHSFDKAKDVPGDRHESVQTCIVEGSKNPELCGAQILTCTQRLAPSFIPMYRHTSGTAPGASKAPIIARPYRSRKVFNRSVVRLAPDLPPVNLPSSVRVISQSVFAKNQSETSSKTCIINGGMSDVSGRGNFGIETPCFSADRDNNGPPSEKVVDLQEDVPAESSSGMDKRSNDSDLQMHPLLFRTPEHGQITCYPANRDPGGSSFSFFSENRPQLLSLFNSPKQINHSADQLHRNSSSNEYETAQGDICFHPLLQRTEYETSYVISRRGNLDPDIGKKDNYVNFRILLVLLEPFSSSTPGKNVNLDIYLSTSSSKVNNGGSVSAANISEAPDICMAQLNDGSEVPGSAPPSDNISRCIEEMADQSNLGIVMEQEELSDSDDEMMEEEHVEFECEEMADSEGEEGSECEENIEMQDKDNRNSVVEITSTDVDSGKELGKDSPNSPWLSLDPSSRRLSSNVKDREKIEAANETTISQFGPSRSRKKGTPVKSRDAESKEEAGVARLRLGPLALPPMKKPRKCGGQAETSPSIETT
ncbi:putative acting on peptide bonds (peptidase) transcription factor MYB-HB-like family [Arabidopsis thaliana]